MTHSAPTRASIKLVPAHKHVLIARHVLVCFLHQSCVYVLACFVQAHKFITYTHDCFVQAHQYPFLHKYPKYLSAEAKHLRVCHRVTASLTSFPRMAPPPPSAAPYRARAPCPHARIGTQVVDHRHTLPTTGLCPLSGPLGLCPPPGVWGYLYTPRIVDQRPGPIRRSVG